MDTNQGNRRFTAFCQNVQTILGVFNVGNDPAKVVSGVRKRHNSVDRDINHRQTPFEAILTL